VEIDITDYRLRFERPVAPSEATQLRGFFGTAFAEEESGFLMSSAHPALTMLGPCLARTETEAAALLARGLDLHRGRVPVFLVPVERSRRVHQMYDWGARNCELHFCQVRGEFQPFRGISMPTFLPETGRREIRTLVYLVFSRREDHAK
jgi:hypothetical protein